MANITKAELLDSVAANAGVSKAQADEVLSAFFAETTRAVKSGDRVAWQGFGSFSQRQNKARTGRNPQTGGTVKIKASKGMKFTASSKLKETLNSRGAAKKAAKKAPAKKAAAKKTAAKKAPAKKGAAKKAAAKKR